MIKGLTIRNGCGGGGIFFQGCNTSLTVENCTLSDNFGTLDGGAIHNLSTLIVNDSTFSNNFAGLNGGGISNRSFGELIVDNCTFSNNRAGLNSGGAIFNKRKTTINNSTFSGNESGVYGTGAAVYSEGVSLIVNNSTISGNVVAARQHGAIAIGNDVRISRVSEIKNSTISGAGGCIYSEATLKIGGTILETTDLYATISGSHEKITSLGYNLSDDNGNGFLTGPGDLTNTEPLLGPLQNNGGPTFTHALLPGSPAIDTGNPSFTPPPNNDQRDCPFFRVYNGRIDIGSFEVQPPPLPCMTPRPRPTPTPRP